MPTIGNNLNLPHALITETVFGNNTPGNVFDSKQTFEDQFKLQSQFTQAQS